MVPLKFDFIEVNGFRIPEQELPRRVLRYATLMRDDGPVQFWEQARYSYDFAIILVRPEVTNVFANPIAVSASVAPFDVQRHDFPEVQRTR